ncbi:MAG: cation-transporting P-type ATPase [Ruminococcaceae bacterium]|nr:cation-transporting P-type ATPase [Oscillospiraceae bacterium]
MNTQKNESWYDKSIEQIERRFQTERGRGLTSQQIPKIRREAGANNVYETPQGTALAFRRLIPTDLASLILLFAVILAALFDIPIAANTLIGILIVNYAAAVFTFIKAQKVLCGMTEYSLPTAKVMRDGKLTLMDMRGLVPGDVIFLSAGDIVPADCRIFAADGLYINEGMVTGIQSSILKDANFAHFSPGLPMERQFNMAFATSIVTAGNGRAIVTATGKETAAVRLGKAKTLLTHENLKILTTLKKYCSVWSLSMLAMVFIITVASLILRPENGIFHVFLTGVSLAAAAMSELYTAFGYIIVGCGIFGAMKRRHDVNVGALIKNAEKLEELKKLSVLIIPKDGIITRAHSVADKIYASRRLYDAADIDRVDKLRSTVLSGVISTGIYGMGLAALSASSRKITAEEQALIELAESLGLYNSAIDTAHPIIEHMPAGGPSKFETTLTMDSDRQYMGIHRGDAPSILDSCEYYIENGRICRMTTDDRLEFMGVAESLMKSSYRVLAVASGVTGYNNLQRIGAIQSDLTFEGFIAIREPLQPGIAQIVSRCKAAGVRVIMTTDKYSESDKYLAMSIGLIENERGILSDYKFDSLKEDLLRANLPLYHMYTGLSPAKLAKIVTLMRADGERVGLLAGGMNGALLLKKANVGFAASVTISPKAKKGGIDIRSRQTPAYSRIAGGSSFDSEALKFISDVVISEADDKGSGGFSAVVSALEYSRTIYKNLLRMVRYLTTTQLMRIFLIIGALILGITALTPMQIVVSGLVLDLGAILASAFAKPPYNSLILRDDAEEQLERPFFLFARSMLFALFGALCILAIGPILALSGHPLDGPSLSAVSFFAMMACQLITFASLAAEQSLFKPGMRMSVSYLLLTLAVAAFAALSLVFPEFGAIFDIVPIGVPGFIGIASAAVLTLAVNEIYKLVSKRAKK